MLSRWNMAQEKLTVSRVQALVNVGHDGSATLLSSGKGPTLVRFPGGPWNPLFKGQPHRLNDGDEISLDCNNPEGAVFTLRNVMQQGGGFGGQGGYAHQGGFPPQGGGYPPQQGGFPPQGGGYPPQGGGYGYR